MAECCSETANAEMSRWGGPLSIVGSFERLFDVDGGILMKYMLLVHHDEEVFGKFSETKQQQMLEESVQLTHQLHANGKYLSAAPLHPASTAAIVRVRDGKNFVTDGPFIETREQIAGYFLIPATDIEQGYRHSH